MEREKDWEEKTEAEQMRETTNLIDFKIGKKSMWRASIFRRSSSSKNNVLIS